MQSKDEEFVKCLHQMELELIIISGSGCISPWKINPRGVHEHTQRMPIRKPNLWSCSGHLHCEYGFNIWTLKLAQFKLLKQYNVSLLCT